MSVRDLIILGCSSQVPTRHRNQGGYLLRWNEEGFLFDPGEGTQRQFIFANIAPPTITRIFISHFHGDHCLGLGSMLLRLNLDNIAHEIHCYYPKSGQEYFDRLRYSSIYHEKKSFKVVCHPMVDGQELDDGKFTIQAFALDHGTENLAWRIKERDRRRFSAEKLTELGVKGPLVKQLQAEGEITVNGEKVALSDVSWIEEGEVISVVLDTRLCDNAALAAKGARVLLCESTYLEEQKELATEYHHLTAKQAAHIAKQAGVKQLVLTHFSSRYQDEKEFEKEAKEIFANSYAAHDLARFPFPRNG